MPIVTLRKWLYNAVGFAVRCDRDTVALTCLKIIHPSLLQIGHNAQFHIPPKGAKFGGNYVGRLGILPLVKELTNPSNFCSLGGIFCVGFPSDDMTIFFRMRLFFYIVMA